MDIYVHRSGRTARASDDGLAVALVTPKEKPRLVSLIAQVSSNDDDGKPTANHHQPLDDRVTTTTTTTTPTPFPVDLGILPQAKHRMHLAIRIDEIERKQRKDWADVDWFKRHAEEIGVAYDPLDHGHRSRAAQRGKGGRGIVTEADAGPHGVSTAQKLRKELATALAEPLRGRFSTRYFAAGSGMELGAGDDWEEGGAAMGAARAAVRRGVALATEVVSARQQQQQQQKEKQKQKNQEEKKNKKEKEKGTSPSLKTLREQRQAALRKVLEKKGRGGGGRGMALSRAYQSGVRKKLVVVAPGGGRQTGGTEALAAVKNRMGRR